MCTGIPTKQKLLAQFEDLDCLLKDLLDKVNRRPRYDDIEHIIFSLLDKDKELKATLQTVSEQMEIQTKIERIRADCENSDAQINACQQNLKKCELLQKLDSMVKAVKNPTDIDELIKYAHRISCTYGSVAPDNWTPGDPRRPYPNKEEIRRGYLGHLDDSGKFLPTLKDAVAQFQPSVNTPAAGAVEATPSQQQMSLASSAQLPNLTSVSSESLENSSIYSPSAVLPGVNITPSPGGMGPSNGSGSGWIEPRHTTSLNAILSGGGSAGNNNRLSGYQSESPSPNMWHQQQLRQTLPGVHTSTPPQQQIKRPLDDMRMYSDNSEDDGGLGF
ncbi:unnamed protein product [Rodentolepis nana]|uniref:Mediator of RNA polymerase II transcription subunit 4 n=1 Tax=Rodentolepis nana TaxID=102285 RepID=A0A0R3T1G1_RODNA|nr:unnamed protein product [Rodentolepis nana]